MCHGVSMGFDFDDHAGSLRIAQGLPYPNWNAVREALKAAGRAADTEAWREVALEWLDKMCDALGSEAILYASPRVVLLSTRSDDQGERLVNFAERTLASLSKFLPALAMPVLGPYVIVLFDSYERFYDYLSEFHRDGEYGGAGGIYINRGYGRIAIPSGHFGLRQSVIAHELTHAFTRFRYLPLWLDEALAMRMQHVMLKSPGFSLGREEQLNFSAFWTPERIQHFWSGAGFKMPG